MGRKMAGVLAVLATAGCGGGGGGSLSPDDPRVGSYRGAFQGCAGMVGGASLDIDEQGIAFFDSDLNWYVESGSEYNRMTSGGRDIRFSEVRNSLGDLTAYDVDATLSADGQRVTGTFTATTTLYGETAQAPNHCQFALERPDWDPLFVDSRAAEFTCASHVNEMQLPTSTTGFSDFTSPTAPTPSCFAGPYYAARFRPPATGLFDVSARKQAIIEGDNWFRPTAVFSACTGRELQCSTGDVVLPLTQFDDVLLVSAGDNGVAFQLTLR